MANKPKGRGETELEWAERNYTQSQAAWDRFVAAHGPNEPTSWPAVVADNLATLELRRAGDNKTMVRTNVDAWLAEVKRNEKPNVQEEPWAPASVLAAVKTLGKPKFDIADVTDDLYQFAVDWLAAKPTPIGFEFLRDLRQQMDDGKGLSVAQAKGVLNCVLADARRATPHATPPARTGVAPTTSAPERAAVALLSPGIYVLTEGKNAEPTVIKVQAALHGSQHLYAKRLVVQKGGKGKFEYEKGLISKLTEGDKMSLEQAKEFGAIYGVCCVCGALLTNEDSIEAGIGPVCSGKLVG